MAAAELPPMQILSPPARPARTHRLWWLVPVVAMFALGNVAFLPIVVGFAPTGPGSLSQMLLSCEMGNILAQFLTLAFFAVLGPGGNLQRQGVVWLVAAIL